MRHKWIHKKGFSECVKCGCSKQKYYGLLLYFVDGIKDPFLKAPPCKIKTLITNNLTADETNQKHIKTNR